MRRAVSIALLALLVLASCGRAKGEDLDGRPVDPFAQDAAATVLVFVSTDCPIANRYAPIVERLGTRLASRHVAFYVVYPLASETRDAVRTHAHDYGYTLDVLRDPAHALVERAGVTVTPEAAVFVHGELVYRGRIDDRDVDFGTTRLEPTRNDLALALDEVLAGHAVSVPRTTAIGCSIPPR